MMNRRSFLTTLALLPGLGWLKPPAAPAVITFAHAIAPSDRIVFDCDDVFWEQAKLQNVDVAILYEDKGTLDMWMDDGPPKPHISG